MNNLLMDFSAPESGASSFQLVCRNNAATPWKFYVYQTELQPSPVNLPLAWLTSPYKIAPGAHISFRWDPNYCFVWAGTGELSPEPGVVYEAGGIKPCELAGANKTTFSNRDDTPDLSDPEATDHPGALFLDVDAGVEPGRFVAGVGMSGQPLFLQQALPTIQMRFLPRPRYFIAAASQAESGAILSEETMQGTEVVFPPGCRTMYATLNAELKWVITQKP